MPLNASVVFAVLILSIHPYMVCHTFDKKSGT